MSKEVEKYPPIPEERRKKYEDYWLNGRSIDGIDPEVAVHLARIKAAGGGKGLEVLSAVNKDYLGAFMAPFSRDLSDADIAIIGAPLEKAATVNTSHRFGPKALRDLSKNFMGTTEPWIDGKFDMPFEWTNIIDFGTLDGYGFFDLSAEVEMHIEYFTDIVVNNGVVPFTWGGDHTTSYAPIKACGEHFGPLGLIHFDAHYDLVTYADFPYPYHNGMMFAKNFADGNLDPERMITMGVRGRMTALVGGHAKAFGVDVAMADECRHTDYKVMAERIIDRVGDGPVYLSLDLDGLDSIYNSASSAVEPFGLSAGWIWDVIRHVRASGKVNLVGADVVEYAPYLDPTNKDGYTAAALSWKILCWLSECAKERNGGKNNPTEWDMAFGSVSL